MQAVNLPTQMLLDMFKKKLDEQKSAEGHPYFTAIAVANAVGRDTDDEGFRETTVRSLTMWVGGLVANMVNSVISEIAAVGKIAAAGDAKSKEAAHELLTSMEFVAAVFRAWANSIDLEHLAEFVFDDGKRRHEAGEDASNVKLPDMTEVFEELQAKLDAMAAGQTPKNAKKPDVPVTPADIMKMLFEKSTKPSVN